MDDTNALFSRTLAKLRGEQPSDQDSPQAPQPDAREGQQGIQQETPKAEEVPSDTQIHPGLQAVPKGNQASMKEQWLDGWRTLSDLTSGIEQSDPRFNPLINLLKQADTAFELDNWEEFQIAASRVKNIAHKGS